MKIHFVTGKGGVGKSLLSAGLAQILATRGSTLLVDLGDLNHLEHIFWSAPSSNGAKASGDSSQLHIQSFSGASCLREYALHLLKIRPLVDLFFKNEFSRSLIEVAPGLEEVAIMGKITSGPPRNVGPKMPYDHVVVDAPSTGHFLQMLRAPQSLGSVVKLGPMHDQCKSIVNVLRDPQISRYWVVTQCEESILEETDELVSSLRLISGMPSTILLNRIWPDSVWISLDKIKGQMPTSGLEAYCQKIRSQQDAAKKFMEGLGLECLHVPEQWARSDHQKMCSIAEGLQQNVDQ